MGFIKIVKGDDGMEWDIIVDGQRVDRLNRRGESAIVKRDGSFVVFIQRYHTSTDYHELRIPVGASDDIYRTLEFKGHPMLGGNFRDSDYNEYSNSGGSGACYIATAVYGSYDSPEVWILRRFRDQSLDKSYTGRLFIKTYYAISPALVRWFGNTGIFQYSVKKALDKWTKMLMKSGYSDTPYLDNIDE